MRYLLLSFDMISVRFVLRHLLDIIRGILSEVAGRYHCPAPFADAGCQYTDADKLGLRKRRARGWHFRLRLLARWR